MASYKSTGSVLKVVTIHISHKDISYMEDAMEGGIAVGSVASAIFAEPISGGLCAALGAAWFMIKRIDKKNGGRGCTIVFQQVIPFSTLSWVPIKAY